MIDVKNIKEKLSTKYGGFTNDNNELMLCYTKEQRKMVTECFDELERLQKFKATFDAYELAKKQDFIAYENWLEAEKELNELTCDVKRYFELDDKSKYEDIILTFSEELERTTLSVKLSKVGYDK